MWDLLFNFIYVIHSYKWYIISPFLLYFSTFGWTKISRMGMPLSPLRMASSHHPHLAHKILPVCFHTLISEFLIESISFSWFIYFDNGFCWCGIASEIKLTTFAHHLLSRLIINFVSQMLAYFMTSSYMVRLTLRRFATYSFVNFNWQYQLWQMHTKFLYSL